MDIISVFSLVGGLGLFLYGMEMMSNGLTSVAGAKLRNILEKMTSNVFMGTAVGIVFTAIIQSSSATTSLVVGFVNAELMNLYQAAGVILGANIGTTATGILMTINLEEIAPLFVFIGAVMIMFLKKPSYNKMGEVVLGFGILFMGLSTMSGALDGLKESQQIVNLLTSLSNPVLAVLIGVAVTGVLQSSSAMIGIVIVLASQQLVTLEMSFYLCLGCNVGSTFTAIIASMGGSINGKRAAAFHFIVNVIGTIVMGTMLALFMPQLLNFITHLTGSATATGTALSDALGRDVAYSNTIFKICQVLICLPFYKKIVDFTVKILPDKEEEIEKFHFEYIQNKSPFVSATAFTEIVNEIRRMAAIAIENLNLAVNSLLEVDMSTYDAIVENEEYVDWLDKEINEYLRYANQQGLPKDDSIMVGPLFHVIADIERIGDHASSIANIIVKCDEKNITFTHQHKDSIRKLITLVNEELDLSIEMFGDRTVEHLSEILKLEDKVDKMEKDLQHEYLSNMKKKKTKPRAGMLYSDLAANLERVADHGTNIAFSILNDDSEEVANMLEDEHVDAADFLL